MRFSTVFFSSSPLYELSLSCFCSFFINSLFCFILFEMKLTFSLICWALFEPSPSLTMLTLFSASVISLSPSCISLRVPIMSLISLSRCSMIFLRLSACARDSNDWVLFLSLQPVRTNAPAMTKKNSFLIFAFFIILFLPLFVLCLSSCWCRYVFATSSCHYHYYLALRGCLREMVG